jgi:nucleoside-diphosphate-sugar epimerase
MNAPIVVFGAGQIGTHVTQQLLAMGQSVRQVRRGGTGRKDGAFELRTGDLTNLEFASEVSRDAQAIIHCVTPPYHQWNELLEPLNDAVLHAAKTSQAPLIVLDNLYGYGRPDRPLTETSPVKPSSRKGELRALVAQKLTDAHRDGTAKVSIARAADFYGPGVNMAAIFGDRFASRALAGKPVEVLGPPELLHSYSFAPDVARGLITLALDERSLGEVWHLPVAAAESTAAVAKRFGLKTTVTPNFVLRIIGLFEPAAKELIEMRYQWHVPFVLDDSKFVKAFGTAATSLDDGVAETMKWIRQR